MNPKLKEKWAVPPWMSEFCAEALSIEPFSHSSLWRKRRVDAFQKLLELGLPEKKSESWRYSALPGLLESAPAYERAQGVICEAQLRDKLPGLYVGTLRSILDAESSALRFRIEQNFGRILPWQTHALAALNSAAFGDVLVVSADENTVLEQPLVIESRSAKDGGPAAGFTRVLVLVGAGSKLSILERSENEAAQSLSIKCAEFFIGQEASVEFVRLVDGVEHSVEQSITTVEQASGSQFAALVFGFSQGFLRSEVSSTLTGEGAAFNYRALAVPGSSGQTEQITGISHAAPNTTSNQLIKGIYDGSSRGIFEGMISVSPSAQKTNAYQSSRSILLTGTASAFAKPQLTINADDVRCTHGATVGKIDDEQVFYIQSRGISKDSARRILLEAFAQEVAGSVASEDLRHKLMDSVSARIAGLL